MPAVRSAVAQHRLPTAVIGTVMLVVMVSIAYRWMAWAPESEKPIPQPASAAQRVELQQCTEAAYMVHDVRWAAACMAVAEETDVLHAACVNDPAVSGDPQLGERYCDRKYGVSDGSAECTLPDARAAVLDALLADAERKCRAQAAAPSLAGRRGD
jgi:hypothetical protein